MIADESIFNRRYVFDKDSREQYKIEGISQTCTTRQKRDIWTFIDSLRGFVKIVSRSAD